jgi:hypothetical protein
MNLDQALRDAAEPAPARVGQPPAQALLDRIVRTSAEAVPAPAAARRAGWRTRKTVVAVLTATAAAVAAVTLPNLASGPAYASWTPQPDPLPAADLAGLGDRCVARVGDEYPEYPESDRAARVVHGEQRGDYAYVSVVTPGWSASCFRDHDGNVRNASIIVAPVGAAKLGGRGVELQAWPQLRTGEGHCRLMTGHVGAQVVGVDITVRDGSGDRSRVVSATVEDGYFLAWYPEPIDESGSNRTSLTLRLADGGTVGGLSARDLHDAPVLD